MRLDELWVVFNGEIYNFRQLRCELEAKGCVFKSQCDTEALLHGYRIWGGDLCSHLEGMFAFGIWDDAREELFLGRDHFGQKPLYYAVTDDQFVAASEIVGVRRLLGRATGYRRAAFSELLRYGYIPEPNTFYQDITCLLPGHWMQIKREQNRIACSTGCYWTFEPEANPPSICGRKARAKLDEMLRDAVRSHMLADVEVGAFLSGGIDSSLVTSLAANVMDRPLKTFCIGMGRGELDESPRAARTAAFLGTDHYVESIADEAFLCPPSRVLDLFGQPFGDYSLVPSESVARLAASKVKTVVTGDGGDEVFGGYYHYGLPFHRERLCWDGPRAFLWSVRERWRTRRRKWRMENFGHTPFSAERVRSVLHPKLQKELQDFDLDHYFRKYDRQALDPFRRAQWVDIKTYLPSDILTKVDRCSMRQSLETRPPLLDHRLVEWVMNVPRTVTNPGGRSKALLRQVALSHIPAEVVEAPKRGFGLPADQLPFEDPSKNRPDALRHCVEHELIDERGVLALAQSPFTFWLGCQFDLALETLL